MSYRHKLNIGATVTAKSGDFARFLKEYQNEVEEKLNDVLHKEAKRIQRMAQKDFPVVTGDLKKSGEIWEEDRLTVKIVWTVRYAPFPLKARIAMSKAVKRRRGGIRSHARNALLKLFRSYGGK